MSCGLEHGFVVSQNEMNGSEVFFQLRVVGSLGDVSGRIVSLRRRRTPIVLIVLSSDIEV